MLPSINLTDVLPWLIGLLVGFTIHEASHAIVAYRLGDDTAKRLGRVTLNPIAHLDPTGTMVMIITSLAGFGFGWGKPVPVNPNNLRPSPKSGYAIVAFAGPASNLLVSTVVVMLVFAGLAAGASGLESAIIQGLIGANIVLALFNMIPIPPLDGFSVLLGILPDRPSQSLSRLYKYSPGILMVMVLSSYFFGVSVLGAYLSWGYGLIMDFYLLLGGTALRALGVA